MRSVRTRLAVLTLGMIALVLVPFLLLSYSKITEEVAELGDARLAQSARTLKRLAAQMPIDGQTLPIEVSNWSKRRQQRAEDQDEGHAYETEMGFQYWSNASTLRVATTDLRDLPLDAASPGYADIVWASRPWRVFTLKDPSGAIARAAERHDGREEIEEELLLQNMAPFLLLVPLLAFLVRWAIGRELRPIQRASDLLQERIPDDLSPVVVVDPPAEIAPLVAALNATLAKFQGVLEHERQFTSNAAHELRKPLAGLSVQLGNAAAASDEPARQKALEAARQGVDRMTRIVNQMLDLARWDAATERRQFAPVDLEACIDEELGAVSAAIVQRDLEITRSFVPSPLHCVGWEPGIRTLVRNLLENATRYCDRHGRIDVEGYVADGRPVIAISDTGPGIAPSARDALLRRFARGEDVRSSGSGLGLSIVARIVDIHDGRLVMTEPAHGCGLRIEVHFAR